MRTNIDNGASVIAIKEPCHAPFFVRQWVQDVETCCPRTGIGLVNIVHKDGNVRIDWGSGIFGHNAELVPDSIGKRGNLTVIHDQTHTKNLHVLLKH